MQREKFLDVGSVFWCVFLPPSWKQPFCEWENFYPSLRTPLYLSASIFWLCYAFTNASVLIRSWNNIVKVSTFKMTRMLKTTFSMSNAIFHFFPLGRGSYAIAQTSFGCPLSFSNCLSCATESFCAWTQSHSPLSCGVLWLQSTVILKHIFEKKSWICRPAQGGGGVRIRHWGQILTHLKRPVPNPSCLNLCRQFRQPRFGWYCITQLKGNQSSLPQVGLQAASWPLHSGMGWGLHCVCILSRGGVFVFVKNK